MMHFDEIRLKMTMTIETSTRAIQLLGQNDRQRNEKRKEMKNIKKKEKEKKKKR